MKEFLKNVKFFSQGALRIEYEGNVVYTDPFRIGGKYGDADVIIITHPHFDHLSHEDIAGVIKQDSVFVAAESILPELKRYEKDHQIAAVNPGDVIDMDFMKLSIVPAYNVVKTDKHPKENNWIGCVMKFGEATLYYTSDTEFIPEMNEIKADIIFLPMGRKYTFESVEEAAKAALTVGARIAVPIHYGEYEGTKEDVDEFEKLLENKIEVVRL